MLNLLTTFPNFSGFNPDNGSITIIIIIIIILIFFTLFLYIFRNEPNNLFRNSKYTFKFYGLKNESMYKFLIDFILIHIINDIFTYNVTIAFYEIKDNKLIRLTNDCHFYINRRHKITINELYLKFDGWSNSAFNNEYNHIIVKIEINS